jgi:hypothetical protein
LKAIQKIGSRAILGAYKIAVGSILEVEAGLLPTALRLERSVMQYVVNLHTLPKEHPWWPLSKRVCNEIIRFKSPLVQHLRNFKEVIGDSETKPIVLEYQLLWLTTRLIVSRAYGALRLMAKPCKA